MVGVKQIPLDREALEVPALQGLLSQYCIVSIYGDGSKEHAKWGLSKDKVLVKAYGKRQGEKKSE